MKGQKREGKREQDERRKAMMWPQATPRKENEMQTYEKALLSADKINKREFQTARSKQQMSGKTRSYKNMRAASLEALGAAKKVPAVVVKKSERVQDE